MENFTYEKNLKKKIYNIKTNFVQYQGIIHAIRAYARSHNIIRFSSKLKLLFIPVNIYIVYKIKKKEVKTFIQS